MSKLRCSSLSLSLPGPMVQYQNVFLFLWFILAMLRFIWRSLASLLRHSTWSRQFSSFNSGGLRASRSDELPSAAAVAAAAVAAETRLWLRVGRLPSTTNRNTTKEKKIRTLRFKRSQVSSVSLPHARLGQVNKKACQSNNCVRACECVTRMAH